MTIIANDITSMIRYIYKKKEVNQLKNIQSEGFGQHLGYV